MLFRHSTGIWTDFPELVAGALGVGGIDGDTSTEERAAGYRATALSRLDSGPESGLPEIQAWRAAFARMGLKPTQYRCAAESLLRRFRKDRALPAIHPLIDICNAVSLAYAIPIAVFDTAGVDGDLEVRYAGGDETYLTFAGDRERPEAGEVIFADRAGNAHARRWTNRQSGRSAVGGTTTSALIVAEALHPGAADDVPRLIAALGEEVAAHWSADPETAILSASAPVFEFRT